MEKSTRASSWMINSKALENISGRMAESIEGNGRVIGWMGLVYLSGNRSQKCILGNFMIIIGMDLVYFSSEMGPYFGEMDWGY